MRALPRFAWGWGLLLLVAGGIRLSAQSADDRTMLAHWDDSLRQVATLATLNRYPERGSTASDATPIRRLMYRLRSAELRRSNGDLERALGGLLLEIGQHPTWPWPPFLLARSYEWMHRARMLSGGWSGVLPGELLPAAAWRNIAVTMSVDPFFSRGREYFFDKLLALGERELQEYQAIPLAAELRRPSPDPRAYLAAARQLRALGNADSAKQLLRLALQGGEDLSRLGLERARTAAALGDSSDARRAYWEGADHFTPIGRVAYRYDLEWLVPTDSLKVFDHLSNDSLSLWVHRFWELRDATAGNPRGERLQHHLQRWTVVTTTFRVATPWRKPTWGSVTQPEGTASDCAADNLLANAKLNTPQPSYPGDLRDREALLDHRGMIYLRRGLPDRLAAAVGEPSGSTPADAGSPATLSTLAMARSWLYWHDGVYQRLTFGGSAALGTQAPTTLLSIHRMDSVPERGVQLTRPAALLPSTGQAITTNQIGLIGAPPLARCTGSRDSEGGTWLAWQSDVPRVEKHWSGIVRMYAMGQGDATRALLAFSVAGDDVGLMPGTMSGAVRAVRLRTVAYQPITGQRIDRDTVLRQLPPPSEGTAGLVTGWLELPLPSGDWQIAARITDLTDSAGFSVAQHGIALRPSGQFGMSDLVVGLDGQRLWSAGDGRGFPLNTLGVWQSSTPLDLYYEIFGLAPGQPYQANLQVRGAGANGGQRVLELHANESGLGTSTPVRKVLAIESLAPGSYTLIITITAGRVTTERRAEFQVVLP